MDFKGWYITIIVAVFIGVAFLFVAKEGYNSYNGDISTLDGYSDYETMFNKTDSLSTSVYAVRDDAMNVSANPTLVDILGSIFGTGYNLIKSLFQSIGVFNEFVSSVAGIIGVPTFVLNFVLLIVLASLIIGFISLMVNRNV